MSAFLNELVISFEKVANDASKEVLSLLYLLNLNLLSKLLSVAALNKRITQRKIKSIRRTKMNIIDLIPSGKFVKILNQIGT